MASQRARRDRHGWVADVRTRLVGFDSARAGAVAASAAIFLAAWQAVVLATGVPSVVLPSPVEVGSVLVRRAPAMAPHVAHTAVEALFGLCLGVGVGAALALSMALSPAVRVVLYPYLLAVRVVPLVVVAPLLVLALGTTTLTRVLLAAILTFFPVTVATLDGLLATPASQLDLLRSVDAPARRVVLSVRLPNALPGAFAGLKLAGPLAVQAVVIAEFLAATRGVGFMLLETGRRLETARLFAYLVVLVAFGLAVFGLVSLAERAVRWDDGGGSLADRLGADRAAGWNPRSPAVVVTAAAGLLALLAWHVVAGSLPHAPLYLPGPWAVVESFRATPAVFVVAGLDTLAKFATGWAAGAALGLVLGAMLALAPPARPVAYPYLVGLRVMPAVAVAPVLLIWLGVSFEAAAVIVALSTFFPVTVGAATGLSSMPAAHRALLRSVGASGWRALVAVRLRHAVPSLFAGLKLSTVTGLAGTVVAEWFVADDGLGVLVLQGTTDFLPGLTYAAAVSLFVLGGGLFLAVSAVQRAASW